MHDIGLEGRGAKAKPAEYTSRRQRSPWLILLPPKQTLQADVISEDWRQTPTPLFPHTMLVSSHRLVSGRIMTEGSSINTLQGQCLQGKAHAQERNVDGVTAPPPWDSRGPVCALPSTCSACNTSQVDKVPGSDRAFTREQAVGEVEDPCDSQALAEHPMLAHMVR